MSKRGKSGEIGRRGIGFRLMVQALCVLFLVAVANYLAFHYYERWDFSRSQKFVLADQTKRVLRDLKAPLRITVFLSPTNQGVEAMLYRDVANLLRELQFSREKRVEVEMVDPVRDFGRARELQAKYGFGGNENVLILDYEGNVKFLPVAEMGEFDLSGMAAGNPPRLLAFRGELAITTAVIGLMNPEKPRVYFLEGHGEFPTGADSGLSTLTEFTERQNIELHSLNLADADRVPDSAAALVIAGPRFDLSEREIGLLEDYWDGDGRLIILLNPNARTPALREFLAGRGVIPLDVRVLRTVNLQSQAGVIGIVRDVVGTFLPDSAITNRLSGLNGLFPGAVQALEANNTQAGEAGIHLRPLIQAAEEFWGESDYTNTETGVRYEDDRDLGQPVIIAAVAERGGVKDERVEISKARMVVVGNADFVTNDAIRLAPANLDFFLNALNWSIERTKLIGIAPKPATLISLSLSEAELRSVAFYTLVVIPGAIALLAVVVWWRRRR